MIINKINNGSSILITVLIFVIVYLGYFYITYAGYKNIVKGIFNFVICKI